MKKNAGVVLAVALAIAGGIVSGTAVARYIDKRRLTFHDTAHMPPDAIHGTQEDLPATCTIGQVFIAQDTNKAYACATMWTEIPITIIDGR